MVTDRAPSANLQMNNFSRDGPQMGRTEHLPRSHVKLFETFTKHISWLNLRLQVFMDVIEVVRSAVTG